MTFKENEIYDYSFKKNIFMNLLFKILMGDCHNLILSEYCPLGIGISYFFL